MQSSAFSYTCGGQSENSVAISSRSDEELQLALETAAVMVEKLGVEVLPLFVRLEMEVSRRKEAADALSRATRMAEKGCVASKPT